MEVYNKIQNSYLITNNILFYIVYIIKMDVEYMSIETFNTNKKENLTFEEIKHLPLFRNSFFGLLLTYTIFYVVKRFILGVSRFGYRFLVRVIDEFIIIGLWIFYGFSSYIENEYIYLIL